MQVSQIMNRNVRVIRPDTNVRQAAQEMKTLDVGALPVCDGQSLLGMITDRDIAIRAVADAKDPQNTRVSDIMSPEVVWCFDDASTEEVAAKMADHQVRRIPIVDRQKKLVGVVALADLATSQEDSDTKADTIEGVSEDSGRARS